MQEKVTLENRQGHTLAGVLHSPDQGPVRATALFAHCFTCTKNILAAVHIADALAAEGYRVLRFDFTGLGESEGRFEDTHFSANVEDLLDAAGWLEATYEAPSLLAGHSLGGTAVLAAAPLVPSCKAVATIGSPADAEHVLHLFDDSIERIESEGKAQVKLAGRPFTIRRDFIDDIKGQSVRDGVRGLRRALLIMHSPVDELVSIDEAARLYNSALHPKSFVTLDDADHLLTRSADSRYAGSVLAAWASRYLAAEAPEPALTPGQSPQEGVLIHGEVADGFRVSVHAGKHEWVADEPPSLGGSDKGPTPYDLLSAALGTCTVMTMNFFARREKLPLESSTVTVTHDHVHAQDCAHCDAEEGRIDRLSRVIELKGDLTEDQRQLLLKIADRCPVHKTLHKGILVENQLLDS